jgi:hypothetical protein
MFNFTEQITSFKLWKINAESGRGRKPEPHLLSRQQSLGYCEIIPAPMIHQDLKKYIPVLFMQLSSLTASPQTLYFHLYVRFLKWWLQFDLRFTGIPVSRKFWLWNCRRTMLPFQMTSSYRSYRSFGVLISFLFQRQEFFSRIIAKSNCDLQEEWFTVCSHECLLQYTLRGIVWPIST